MGKLSDDYGITTPMFKRPVTSALRKAVTKVAEPVTKVVTKAGRPKKHASGADRARAYRERRRHAV